MIRPFSLRDFWIVRRLGEDGARLHAEMGHITRHHPLRGALSSMVIGGNVRTFVWRADEGSGSGFVQIHFGSDRHHAHLVCLATTPPAADGEAARTETLNSDGWLALLDGAVTAAGRRGIHSLVAEVDEVGPELPVLRRAGFAVYTRQDIWRLDHNESEEGAPILRPKNAGDEWDIEWLYANTVPPLIQVVEPSPPADGNLWVLREEGRLTAFAHVRNGPVATWLQIFIHPNAYAHTDEIVAAAVRVCAPNAAHPVFFCVRRYQSWLQSALERSGFRLWQSQAVMVKHISPPVKDPVRDLSRLLEGRQTRATTLFERYRPLEERCDRLNGERPLTANGKSRSHPSTG